MKIAIDLTSFNEIFIGGKEQVILNLIEGFYKMGYERDILIFCYEEYVEKSRLLLPKAKFVVFKRNKGRKLIQDIYLRTFKFKKYLKHIDIMFFPIYYIGFAKFKVTTIVIPHDIYFKHDKKAFGLYTKIKDTILYYNDFYRANYIIAISKFDKEELKKYYKKFSKKIKLIENPIKHVPFNKEMAKNNLIAINIGYEHKNIETLIKAYKLIENTISHNLILVGDLYDNKILTELIKQLGLQKRITITGYVSNLKLLELLNSSAIYIIPSKYEGFGMTAVEAMLNNIPVISSTQKALMEVTFNKAYYYSPYNDEKNLAKTILNVLENYPSETYLKELKQLAYNKFNYITIAKRYMAFFNRISTKVFYVDPMSYHNLAVYDDNLLSNINNNIDITFYSNNQFNLQYNKKIKKIYNYSKYNNNLFKMLSYVNSQRRLFNDIKKYKCKVIHMQWSRMPYFDFILIRHIKKKFKIKFIYTSHDTFSHNFEKTKKKYYLKLMKEANEIIVHTAKGKRILKQHGFMSVKVINHGLLDIKKYYPTKNIDSKKKDKIIFSLLGYMDKYKGTDLLLKAWLGSDKLIKNKKIELVVIGKNRLGYIPEIQESDNVLFKDEMLSDSEFTRWMQLTDVVVLPYQRISQSGLLLTALSMKKIFIVNDIGELAKPIKKYDLGWIIKENNVLGLRMKLEDIIDNIMVNGLKKVNEETLKQIYEDYSWQEAGRITSTMYVNK